MYSYKNILISAFILLTNVKFINADSSSGSTNTINIINNTEHSLHINSVNINWIVPEQTEAIIKFKKINSFQDTLDQDTEAETSEKMRQAVLDALTLIKKKITSPRFYGQCYSSVIIRLKHCSNWVLNLIATMKKQTVKLQDKKSVFTY